MEIRGRVALITGTRRIGAVVAASLAERGAAVVLVYGQSRNEALRAADSIVAAGGRAMVTGADVASAEACRRLVARTLKAFGRLDILVNMASLYAARPFDELTEADLDRHLSVDLKGAYLCSLAAVPAMRRGGGGRIVNVTDWLPISHRPRYKGYLPYYVAKAGVIALTEAMALELADEQILVNAIAPGPIMPPPDLDEEESKAVEMATPVGRWGGPGEIAKAVVALVESDFITGETIRVDGGRHLR
jgi:NAD(P)-dependent dehydrogenase (short-subunit alcohol dehydrogenase family)